MRKSSGLGRILRGAVPNVLALVLGLVAASVMMLLAGYDPLKVFSTLFQGALGTNAGQSYILTYTGTLILSAIAFLVPGKAGIFNVGAQGQIYFGGITAALVAVFVPLPPVIWPLAATAAGCLAGAFWAFIPGMLQAYRNTSAIVTTIMLNFVAQPLASVLLFYVIYLKEPTVRVYTTATYNPNATIPGIPFFVSSTMIFVAIAVSVVVAVFLGRTTLGYNIRAVGLGPQPAEAKGINPRLTMVLAMVIGGLVAGLAGVGDVLSPGHGCGAKACYIDGFAQGAFGGEGFAGITVALVGANNPIGSIFSAVFFAILVAGQASIAAAFPGSLYAVWAMEGLIIIFMAMPYLSTLILSRGRSLGLQVGGGT
ncbi:MAG TPA: ABC transporter permease [Nitrososphaerales archaeon]|nr:ABC transporter permease [Nitrososphaerales archaeon]